MRRATRQKWQRRAWLIAGLVVLMAVIGVWVKSTAPRRAARATAVRIAATQANVTDITNFYWDTQRESYFAVAGKNAKRQPVFVVIREKTKQFHVLRRAAGVSKAQVEARVQADYAPRRITSIGISQRGKKFVWDVGYRTNSGKLGYVTYDFATGNQVAAIRNL
ncbi:cell wall elongation regulator TseB-like domain-containing protein [Lacticaseibacillus daqingensis]|uniref:cell wall elongation regulator TseB-like domain-containing protein n=1 Tax=Lacticaseibacillus daqingensis TaxID=2486014 RepID=UPI000F784958|nr:DUF5590 domain-containing protein [Lacticaseibacillus daqingensis]